MATYGTRGASSYTIGSAPPTVTWTVVKGDTASFRVYATDDGLVALDIGAWTLDMEIKRPTTPGDFTQNSATLILTLVPTVTSADSAGEFTVSLTAANSTLLLTGDIFDIEIRDATRVWTLARGTMVIIEDVTN